MDMKVLQVIAIVIAGIIVIAIVSAGMRALLSTETSTTSTTLRNDTADARASYKRIGMNACTSEAQKSVNGFTAAQANQYCKCVIDRVYVGTLANMQKQDTEYNKNGFTPAQEKVILDCTEELF